jgi:hypothetical protein
MRERARWPSSTRDRAARAHTFSRRTCWMNYTPVMPTHTRRSLALSLAGWLAGIYTPADFNSTPTRVCYVPTLSLIPLWFADKSTLLHPLWAGRSIACSALVYAVNISNWFLSLQPVTTLSEWVEFQLTLLAASWVCAEFFIFFSVHNQI